MTARITEPEFKLLRDFIEKQCGVLLGDDKAYLIENRLAGLLEESACSSFGEFYLKLKNSPSSRQLRELTVDAITTNETFWLRDQHPFDIFRERLLPEFREEILLGKREKINIWSAACSTGQEPYSIAMTALDFYRTSGGTPACREQVQILATDISSDAISGAKAGKYDAAAMARGLPSDMERHFQKENASWVIRDNLKEMIAFKQFNLQGPFVGLGQFDAVFLRNVIIYFSDTFKQDLLNRVARLLTPSGYMFLGAGETISGYTMAFDVLEHGGAIYYQVKQ